jgi:tetratricopeptide (TPR) repeat protein
LFLGYLLNDRKDTALIGFRMESNERELHTYDLSPIERFRRGADRRLPDSFPSTKLSDIKEPGQPVMSLRVKNPVKNKYCLVRICAIVRAFEATVRTMCRSASFAALISVMVALMVLPCPSGAQDYLDYYEQGEFALAVERWSRAAELFTKSIEDNPKFFMAYHNRAIAYSKLGEYDRSIEDLKNAVQLNPDYSDAYGRMGLIHEIRKQYSEALKMYQEALVREKRPTVRKIIQKYIQDVDAKMKKK